MAHATDSIVLLGDPQQLDQPRAAPIRPAPSDRRWPMLLGGDDPTTVASSSRTWRCTRSSVSSPRRCSTTTGSSPSRPRPARQKATGDRRRRRAPAAIRGERRRRQRVAGEADVVADVAASSYRGTWTNGDGARRSRSMVRRVGRRAIQRPGRRDPAPLPPEARVGTVDKFQGQEAPISIYSLTTSSPELAPRGMDFLYSRNRLNVATSRARCVALVVGSPDLFRVRARTPAQMRLANAFAGSSSWPTRRGGRAPAPRPTNARRSRS